MQHILTPARLDLRPWSVKALQAAAIAATPPISPGGLTFTGYGSVFGVLDRGGDVVMPGAFAASLARHAAEGTRPKGLWQHDPEQPILTWAAMAEDAHGLLCTGRLLPGVGKADEAAILLAAGEIDALSIGFEVVAERRLPWRALQTELGLAPDRAGDFEVRALDVLDLWEVSPVTFPMCVQARISEVTPAAPEAAGKAAQLRPLVTGGPLPAGKTFTYVVGEQPSEQFARVSPPASSAFDLAAVAAALERRGAALARCL